MPERRYLPIQLPQLDVVPVNQRLGALFRVFLLFEYKINAIDDVPIRANDIGVEADHRC